MKLRVKITLQILAVTLLFFWSAGLLLLWQGHQADLAREQERSINEFDLFSASLQSALAVTSDPDHVMELYNNRYNERSVYLVLYDPKEATYSAVPFHAQAIYQELIGVSEGEYRLRIAPDGEAEHRFFFLAATVGEKVLIYQRDIEETYASLAEYLRLYLLLSVGMSVIILAVSALLARRITRPLEQMERTAAAIAAGDYSLHLKEGKDELGTLAASFNQMTRAVRTREEEQARALEERQLFIDSLAHEMNTPLTSVQGYADFLLRAPAGPEQRLQALRTIKRETARLVHLREELYQLTVLRTQKPERRAVSTEVLFASLSRSLRDLLQEQHVTLVSDLQVPLLESDAGLLEIFASNLLRNAARYAPDSTVTFAVRPSPEGPVLSVEDHGCGIPEEQQKQVLEPFYRVDKSRSRKTGGTGLGLTLCVRVAEALGGRFELHSVLGSGTTVSLTLPDIVYNSDTNM